MPWNVHSVTVKVKRGQLVGNKFLDDNLSLSRVQAYSPTLRAPQGQKHAAGGVQWCGESLLKISNNVVKDDNGGYIRSDVAVEKLNRWIALASDHLTSIRSNGSVCRLELTFKGGEEALEDDFNKSSLTTLMKCFHGSVKAHDCHVIIDLGMFVLSAMKGLGDALVKSWCPHFLSEVPDYNEFGEVWSCLNHMALNFFSGRNLFFTQTSYCPKLCYLYSRCLLKSSWKGINASLEKVCYDEDNLLLLKKELYFHGGIDNFTYEKIVLRNARFLQKLDTGDSTNTSFNAFNNLYLANCNKEKRSFCRAVVCPRCWMMTSEAESCLSSWSNHTCRRIDDRTNKLKTISIDSDEYRQHLIESTLLLSLSQREAHKTILECDKNYFLTGVAGSGKSHTLNQIYPRFVFYYGYQCVQLTAPTNRAAANINGITLHRLVGLTVDNNSLSIVMMRGIELDTSLTEYVKALQLKNSAVIEKLSLLMCLIIDEAGMLSDDLFHFVSALLKKIKNNKNPFGGVRVILVGDVLQLPPMESKKKNSNFFFADSSNFNSESFKVAYLRENHRQKNSDFLVLLNMVRVGDVNAIPILNGGLFAGKNVSKLTLSLAKSQNEHIFNSTNSTVRESLIARITYSYLVRNRIHLARWENNIDGRIEVAEDTSYSDLIVCCEKSESESYRKLRCEVIPECDRFLSESLDNCENKHTHVPLVYRDEYFTVTSDRLLKQLELFIGMQYRITCNTGNRYFCTNTFVIIKNVIMQESRVKAVEVSSLDNSVAQNLFSLERIKIMEENGQVTSCRSQFPLVPAIGLLPWSLQCMTVSENIFYDNSRMGGKNAQKGFLYTILSRIKNESQMSFLHPITDGEVMSINKDALKFDNLYRNQTSVIMDVIDEVTRLASLPARE